MTRYFSSFTDVSLVMTALVKLWCVQSGRLLISAFFSFTFYCLFFYFLLHRVHWSRLHCQKSFYPTLLPPSSLLLYLYRCLLLLLFLSTHPFPVQDVNGSIHTAIPSGLLLARELCDLPVWRAIDPEFVHDTGLCACSAGYLVCVWHIRRRHCQRVVFVHIYVYVRTHVCVYEHKQMCMYIPVYTHTLYSPP